MPLAALVLVIVVIPTDVTAQNTDPPEVVVKLVNDIKLGVQVGMGVQRRDQTIHPLRNRGLKYLQRRVSGELPYTMPYYGIGIALNSNGARVSFTYRIGNGVQPKQWLKFRGGASAIPYTLNYDYWSVRAEYLVLDWVGAGVKYWSQIVGFDQSFGAQINGVSVSSILFSGRAERSVFAVYVPLQKSVGSWRLFGQIGTSVFGTAQDYYETNFVRYQSPEYPGRATNRDPDVPVEFTANGQSVNAQFGHIGAAVPIWTSTVRAAVGIERLHVPGMSTTWSYDVRLEVGLPF